ncbi:hypothetical protein Pla108_14330 [Botrimarina colliarenosi]|uniref:Uncharacterized protein n=1 Tax=Botrimarina colliarenosi TaxID=2528001 RepID=A0A5C6AN95_9BACT|nr:hypothetical protein [Botrimarina colliarenosi]TWU00482.1 hypothetical protein Pla108_14330 [Botrimarina colliarenosi]
MTDRDKLPGDWVRDLHRRVARSEGSPLSPSELQLVARFAGGRLDETDAEYVALRAAAEESWDRAVSAAILAAPDEGQASDATTSDGLGEESRTTLASSREYELHFGPIATLAAADLVKASVRWEAGNFRLLQSPMRADLAIDITIDEGRREEFVGVAFVFHPGGTLAPITFLADASPVFSRLYADHFAAGLQSKIDCVPIDDLTAEQLDGLKRSRRNLRDPGCLALYDEAVARAERRP